MRIVVVDDSEERVALIQKSLETVDFAKYLDVVYCDSADAGRKALMIGCDLLLLDVLIPRKTGGTPQAKNSVALLTDVCSSRKSFIRPGLIIGLTADINELGSYREQFANEATTVLSGTLSDISWVDRLIQQIDSLLGSHKKVSQRSKDRLFLSVHGIRTYGHWQNDLSVEISEHSRSFECVEVKYEFVDVVSFLIPRQRGNAIARVADRVREVLEANQDREVFIVAHSFGTLIVTHALKNYVSHQRIKVTIFCGSPMCHEDDIDCVVNASELLLNDCGIHDFVLIAARFFGIGLGDAGRIGFARGNSDCFRNRYFRGGHGLYFQGRKKFGLHYQKFWLPVIISGEKPLPVDARKSYLGQDLAVLFIKFMTATKPYSGITLVVLCFVSLFILGRIMI